MCGATRLHGVAVSSFRKRLWTADPGYKTGWIRYQAPWAWYPRGLTNYVYFVPTSCAAAIPANQPSDNPCLCTTSHSTSVKPPGHRETSLRQSWRVRAAVATGRAVRTCIATHRALDGVAAHRACISLAASHHEGVLAFVYVSRYLGVARCWRICAIDPPTSVYRRVGPAPLQPYIESCGAESYLSTSRG